MWLWILKLMKSQIYGLSFWERLPRQSTELILGNASVPSTDRHPTTPGIDSAPGAPSLPPSLPACLHKTPIHLGRREWKTWRAHRVIFVSRSLQPPSLSASGACLETGFFISVTKKHCQNMSWRELWKLHFLLNGLCWIILRVYFRVFQNTFKQCG